MASGNLITLEGGEGSGKSTLVKRLAASLSDLGMTVELTREPGGTEFANKVRKLLVEKQEDEMDAVTESLLVNAARRHHLQKKVIPLLEKGTWVICDRFIDSTRVYQGFVQGVPSEFLDYLHGRSCFGKYPDLTLFLDVPVQVGLNRTQQRQESQHEQRFEDKGIAFHNRVRAGFLELAKKAGNRIHTIDASQSEDDVFNMAVSIIKSKLL